MEYSIVFDTNNLFVNYNKGGDFTKFYFNATFKNIIGYIEKSDLYEYVEILIPSVIWNEMKKQKIENYTKKKEELENKINKIKIPEITFEKTEIDYNEYIDKKILEYKDELKNNIVSIKEIQLPNETCFESIVNRVFNKIPPFEGKDKESDKGFKDALLWESILEYKKANKDKKIILYSNDNIFDDFLKDEFKKKFNDNLEILKNEEEMLKILTTISKKINKYTYVNNEIEEIEKIKEYLESKEFRCELLYSISSVNQFPDVYIIEDINNINILSLVPRDIEEKRYYEAKLEFNALFNKIKGNTDDIIEKKENIDMSFMYNDGKVEKIEYEYRHTVFDNEE